MAFNDSGRVKNGFLELPIHVGSENEIATALFCGQLQ
jgi:hypothetical protein